MAANEASGAENDATVVDVVVKQVGSARLMRFTDSGDVEEMLELVARLQARRTDSEAPTVAADEYEATLDPTSS